MKEEVVLETKAPYTNLMKPQNHQGETSDATELRRVDWQVAETFTKFLYPFVFTHRLKSSVEACGNDFSQALLSDPELSGVFVEDPFDASELENMLPYVKQYLSLATNQRRFRMNLACLSAGAFYAFLAESEKSSSFRISQIVLYVFFNGVACLALEIRPTSEDGLAPSVEDVERVNARLASLIHGAPFRMVIYKPSDTEPVVEPQGWSIALLCQKHSRITLKLLIDDLLKSFFSESSLFRITPMVDRFLPVYGAMLLRPDRLAGMDVLDERFYEFAQHHLTILRKTFTPNDISHFSQIHLEDATHHYLPYHNVIHTQSLDGGFVLAYDNGLDHFAKRPARAMESFRTSYFLMMLIPFHQRLSILRYAMGASLAGLSPRRGEDLRTLREAIYDFTSRCYFSQASVSEERDHIYRRWQDEFHVVPMYNELKEEVHDIDNYLAGLDRERENMLKDLSLRRDSRNMHLFGLITMIFLPVTILVEAIPAIPILHRWINFAVHPVRALLIVAAMVAFIVVLLALLFRNLRQSRKTLGL